jgi:hypothetical protein
VALTFKGTYVFKQDGKEIGRSENLITTNGRKVLLQYLAGTRVDWAADMCFGAIDTAPSLSDIELNFETARVPVSLKTYKSATSGNPDLVIVRGTLPASLYANIYEIGLYPESKITDVANRNNRIITDFSDLSNWVASIADQAQSIVDQGTVSITGYSAQGAASPRIGGFSVDLAQNTSYQNNTFGFNLLGYSDLDTLKILAYNTAAGIVTITLKDVQNNSYVFTYTLSDNAGYQILSAQFPANVSFTNTINSITITTDNTASVTIDAIKASVSTELTNEDYLISKSVLSTPIAKIYGTPLDVEYYVQIM